MKTLFSVIVFLVSLNSFAAIYNTQFQREVLDVATDPNLQYFSDSYTSVWEMCYTGDMETAHQELLALKDQEVILYDSESDEYVDSTTRRGALVVQTYSSKVRDEGEDPYSFTAIPECNF